MCAIMLTINVEDIFLLAIYPLMIVDNKILCRLVRLVGSTTAIVVQRQRLLAVWLDIHEKLPSPVIVRNIFLSLR